MTVEYPPSQVNTRLCEGVKREHGFAYFWTGKMGFWLLGLGTNDTKMRMGKPIYNYKDSNVVWTFQSLNNFKESYGAHVD